MPDYVSKPKRKTNNKQRGKKTNKKTWTLKNPKIAKGALKTTNDNVDDSDYDTNSNDYDDDVTLSALKTTALAKKKNKKNTWTKT